MKFEITWLETCKELRFTKETKGKIEFFFFRSIEQATKKVEKKRDVKEYEGACRS